MRGGKASQWQKAEAPRRILVIECLQQLETGPPHRLSYGVWWGWLREHPDRSPQPFELSLGQGGQSIALAMNCLGDTIGDSGEEDIR
eukprot:scaffold10980_cov125-Isochrysis_galbana.AAC.5